jgi:hypothetical protein
MWMRDKKKMEGKPVKFYNIQKFKRGRNTVVATFKCPCTTRFLCQFAQITKPMSCFKVTNGANDHLCHSVRLIEPW